MARKWSAAFQRFVTQPVGGKLALTYETKIKVLINKFREILDDEVG